MFKVGDPLLDFVKTLKRLGLEFFDLYYSEYPGIVTDNNDPEKRGRIKAKVPTIFGEQELAQWILPSDNRMASSAGGEMIHPNVDDVVSIRFEFGNLNYPRYSGGFYRSGEVPGDFSAGYPNVRGWVFKGGQKILVDETEGKKKITLKNDESVVEIDETSGQEVINIKHKSGSSIVLGKDGVITVKALSEGVSILSGGNVSVKSDKNVDIESTQDMKMSGKTMTTIGRSSSMTKIDGNVVQIAGGGLPSARVTSQVVVLGNLGMPASGIVTTGSMKVLVP